MAKTIVRTENHGLVTTDVVRQDMARTIAAYRRVVRMCATIALVHWTEFEGLRAQERQQALEQLIHATKQRHMVRYPMMARVLGQMPSYLRRAALSAALGAVSSYLTNYDNWLDDAERDRGTRPPRLGFSNVYPSLYGGNMILEDSKLRSVRIKLLGADGQWCFSVPLKVKGHMKRLPHRLDLSPSLVLKGAKAMLVCPVAVTPLRFCKSKDVGRVCAVDVGINTALTAVVVSSTGTVIARTFLTCGRHDGQRDALRERIQEKQSASGRSGRGFCRDLYRRIAGLSLDAARQLSSQLVEFARAHGAQAFVFEALKGWKPKGRGKVQRKRFHRFQHRALFKAVALRAEEMGLRMLEVFAGGTSRWAYDGSGKVERGAQNAQLATFATGKQYNADLNAANNIAARGLALLYGITNPRKAKDPSTGTRMLRHSICSSTRRSRSPVGRRAASCWPPLSAQAPRLRDIERCQSASQPLVLADVWAYARSLGASLTASGALSDAPSKSPAAIY